MMDTLHGVMRALTHERKTDAKPADHLSVFREFISHLDKIARQNPKPQTKRARTVKRRARR